MRWKQSSKQKQLAERYGKKDRVVKRFIWLPKCINGEWRLWEVCHIQQTVFRKIRLLFGGVKYVWADIEWVD